MAGDSDKRNGSSGLPTRERLMKPFQILILRRSSALGVDWRCASFGGYSQQRERKLATASTRPNYGKLTSLTDAF